MKLGDVSVGERVQLLREEEWEDWVVVQHGPPSSDYGGMEGGTVLMKRDYVNTDMVFNIYAGRLAFDECAACEYLNGDFLDSLDPAVAQAVMEAELPCLRTTSTGSRYVGSMKARVWLPSIYEITSSMQTTDYEGNTQVTTPYIREGSRLDYWRSASYGGWAVKGIPLYGGGNVDKGWSTRTPNQSGALFYCINASGQALESYSNSMAVYPCLVLPDRAEADGETGRITIPEGNARVRIDGVWARQSGLWCRKDGVWHKGDKLCANIDGVWKG